MGDALSYLRDAPLIVNDGQELAPIKLGEGKTGSIYCRFCEGNFESKDGKMTSNPTEVENGNAFNLLFLKNQQKESSKIKGFKKCGIEKQGPPFGVVSDYVGVASGLRPQKVL